MISVRNTKYRDRAGFSVVGKDSWGRSISIFVRTKAAAEKIRNAYKQFAKDNNHDRLSRASSQILHEESETQRKESEKMPGKKASVSKHSSSIVKGIARGVWADHWATQQEEEGKHFPSGTNLYDVAPPAPAWAKKWAEKVADDIVKANRKSLEELYEMVRDRGRYPHDAESFGYHLGMQTAGHGVSWSDDSTLPHKTIEIPYREFYEI